MNILVACFNDFVCSKLKEKALFKDKHEYNVVKTSFSELTFLLKCYHFY